MLEADEVKRFLVAVERDFPHDECRTCECYLGYLVQLELDASTEIHPYLETLKPIRSQMHACLGCDPCPPGDHYQAYLRGKQQETDSTGFINVL